MTNPNVGVLPDGRTFHFPDTMSVMEALTTGKSLRRPGAILWVGSWMLIGCSPIFYFMGVLPLWFFVVNHVAWRLAYNAGIGYMLKTQSSSRKFEKFYERAIRHPLVKSFLETSVVFRDNTEYKTSQFPDSFNAWMLFRQLENIILANDLSSYVALFMVCTSFDHLSVWALPRILLGVVSVPFSLWSKTDAHRVIGEFAWYWGDFFFLVKKNLIFDGIFQMFPHPMYTAGYGFIYGLPLLSNSFTLFWVGVFAHMCQVLFLVFVEDPHIQKTYATPAAPMSEEDVIRKGMLYGKNDSEIAYFEEQEVVLLKNISLAKPKHAVLVGVALLKIVLVFTPISPLFFLAEYIFWRLLLHGVLGYVLYRQSKDSWFVKKFSSPQKAFDTWKYLYNFCVTMNVLSFLCCTARFFSWNGALAIYVRSSVFLIDLSLLLMILGVYSYCSSYSITREFGYYFADFFIARAPRKLSYDGIYRYFNMPEVFVGAGLLYGIAILSGSLEVFGVAVFSHATVFIFTLLVEKPHILQTYGDIRMTGGLASEVDRRLKSVIQHSETKKNQ